MFFFLLTAGLFFSLRPVFPFFQLKAAGRAAAESYLPITPLSLAPLESVNPFFTHFDSFWVEPGPCLLHRFLHTNRQYDFHTSITRVSSQRAAFVFRRIAEGHSDARTAGSASIHTDVTMILRRFWFLPLVLLLDTFPSGVLADQILKTSGFSTCLSNSPITVQKVDIEYNNDNKVS